MPNLVQDLIDLLPSAKIADERRRAALCEWLTVNPAAAIRMDFTEKTPQAKARLARTLVFWVTGAEGYLYSLAGIAGIRRLGTAFDAAPANFFAVDFDVFARMSDNPVLQGEVRRELLDGFRSEDIELVEILGDLDFGATGELLIAFQEEAVSERLIKALSISFEVSPVTDPLLNRSRYFKVSTHESARTTMSTVLHENRDLFRIADIVTCYSFRASNRLSLSRRFQAVAKGCDARRTVRRDRGDELNPGVENRDWMDQINLPRAWELVAKELGAGWRTNDDLELPVVAVVDGAVDFSHPALARAWRGGQDYNAGEVESVDDQIRRYRHGTSVAGLIAGYDPVAAVDDDVPRAHPEEFCGVAAGVGLLGVRVCAGPPSSALTRAQVQESGFTPVNYDLTGVIQALNALAEAAKNGGASVVNLSCELGSGSSATGVAIIEAIQGLVKNGRNGKGTVVVVAAGNYSGSEAVTFPADRPEVVCVAATSRKGVLLTSQEDPKYNPERFYASSYAPEESVTVAAPGTRIVSTDSYDEGDLTLGSLPHGYATFGSTSGAAAIVSGVVALMLAVNPALTAQDVKTILQRTATLQLIDPRPWAPYPRPPGDPKTWPPNRKMQIGFLDAGRAVEAALKWPDWPIGGSLGTAGAKVEKAKSASSKTPKATPVRPQRKALTQPRKTPPNSGGITKAKPGKSAPKSGAVSAGSQAPTARKRKTAASEQKH